MAIILPSWSSSGPPELPGLIAASVWIRPLKEAECPEIPSWAVINRLNPETTPVETVLLKSA